MGGNCCKFDEDPEDEVPEESKDLFAKLSTQEPAQGAAGPPPPPSASAAAGRPQDEVPPAVPAAAAEPGPPPPQPEGVGHIKGNFVGVEKPPADFSGKVVVIKFYQTKDEAKTDKLYNALVKRFGENVVFMEANIAENQDALPGLKFSSADLPLFVVFRNHQEVGRVSAAAPPKPASGAEAGAPPPKPASGAEPGAPPQAVASAHAPAPVN